MNDVEVVASARGVSKKFCKYLRRSMAYGIADLSRNLLGVKPDSTRLRKGEFWALDDMSFDLKRGEAVGLIGVNGSGKTTLLRLLAGILPPDRGEIMIKGRVGALIALGAGFHPHMTGRENIHLNGAILGMSRAEIESRYHKIVDFAGIGDFLDAPVSTYSSGMRVRLGFAVATAIQPQTVLVDEVLAVGDLRFRTKCLNRLNQMRSSGTSFILVSHNMTNIVQFTERAIWLDNGRLRMDGESLEVASAYTNSGDGRVNLGSLYGEYLVDHPDFKAAAVSLRSDSGEEVSELAFGEWATITFSFRTGRELLSPNVSFPIYHETGSLITTIASVGRGVSLPRRRGAYSGRVRFGPVNFNPGSYVMVANLHDGPEHLSRSVAAHFRVTSHAKVAWGVVDFDQDWKFPVRVR